MKTLLTALLVFCVYAVKAQTPVVTFALTTPPCNNNGVVTASFTNVTPPLTVLWQVYSGGTYTTITHTGVTGTSDVLTGYSGAPLYLSVTDAGSNMGYGSYSHPPFTYTVTNTFPSCPTLSTGTVTPSGGTAPYTYQWYDLATNTVVGTTNPISLPNGQYGITIVDATGCVTGSASQPDSVNFYSLPSFNFNVTTTAASCTNGTATVGSITGSGVAPYSYLWSNGATSASIGGLSKGYLSVAVTDAVGCASSRVTYINQTPIITAHVTTTPATCTQANGAITTTASGGTSPYTYLYGNGATTPTITGLEAGQYSVAVRDANGCTGNNTASVTATTPITATYTTVASLCTSATGSATLTIAGGATPYSVSWSTYPVQTGTSATSLAPGNYNFHITDANGCVRTGTVTVPPVHMISVGFSITDATCTQANGSIGATVSGGTAPYTYAWNNSATTASLSSVTAGYYAVTVHDNAGCSVTKYAEINATSPVSLGLSATAASCIFNTDGAITATPSGGATPYSYSWNNGQSTATITNLPVGDYYIRVTDANGCVANNFSHVGYNASNNSCYCKIQGNVYHDANGNCTQDPGEAGLQNIQLHCSGIGYTYTDASGYYSFIVPSGTYTISQTVLSYYPLQSCQNNAVSVTATAAANCTHTVNFADSVTPIHDIHISTWNNNFPIPGYSYEQKMIVQNQGTVAETGIQATYKTDGQLNGATFFPSSIFSGSGNWYDAGSFPTLQPGASQLFNIDYNVPANIPLGTSLVFTDSAAYTSPISNWMNDYSPWNNVDYFTTPVVGSFDPNFIAVSPQGSGPTGLINYTDSTLEYMVHFQNTGTYMAQNIVVLDTLDANLDWTTLRPQYQSSACVVTLNNGIARFAFNNVDLPAEKDDEAGSNGMFTYTVKLKKNLAAGTQIKNRAGIYFDFNKPVPTNSTLNTLNKTSGISNVTAQGSNSFFIYPNPAAGNFNAVVDSKEDNQPAYLNITDLAGKTVISRELVLQKGKQTIAVDAGRLAPGIYIASMYAGGQTQTQKLVIIK
ncbi:MAG: T9SS type A sorting domain-containing protein [Flavipsychrobacter sp.]|nr:T9SS type A sorting domain-containing protein [Flavipsychrobacter sp.]